MALKLPRHRLTHKPTFISSRDSAWDRDKIAQEKEDSDEPHPVDVYLEGKTRYDLDAKIEYGGKLRTVREYLESDDYGYFELIRFKTKLRAQLEDMLSRQEYAQWLRRCAQTTVHRVGGFGDFTVTSGNLDEEQLAVLANSVPDEDERGCTGREVSSLMYEVAAAGWALSDPLRENEKKH